jgi:hypothetical protein
MGYDVRWGNEEKTIMLCELTGEWIWNDFYELWKTQVVMLDTVDHQVHSIIFGPDEAIRVPPGALSHFRRLTSMSHPNEDRVVIVNIPAVAKALLDMLKKIYGVRGLVEQFIFVDSLEEAYVALDEYEKNREQS